MTILSDRDIRAAIEEKKIVIDGMAEDAIQPASIDLRLSSETPMTIGHLPGGGTWGLPHAIDPRVDVAPRMKPLPELYKHPDDPGPLIWQLHSGMFAIASTVERVELGDNMVGRLEGKSSVARLGQTVHITAGFFDPGFRGYPTLELFNNTPFTFYLIAGMPICQMAFEPTSSPVELGYVGKYADQGAAPQPSRYHQNFPL